MALPLISVVIPAYNHERYVGAAIESVLGQSCSDLELIVVDDGSTDGTAEVIQGYTDSRLHYYHQENQDAYNTINRGISLARGRYIAILNSDDIYTTERLETLYSVCEEQGQVCAFSAVIPIDYDGVELTEPELEAEHHGGAGVDHAQTEARGGVAPALAPPPGRGRPCARQRTIARRLSGPRR